MALWDLIKATCEQIVDRVRLCQGRVTFATGEIGVFEIANYLIALVCLQCYCIHSGKILANLD